MTEVGPAQRRMTVIGDGQMGLVMAEALACGGHQVRLWGPFPDHVEQLARTRLSDRLPGYRLGESIEVCSDVGHALDGSDLVVCAIPCQFVRSVFAKLKHHLADSPVLVSVAKGIEIETLERPTEILDSIFAESGSSTVCLSGPTIASELARHQIAIMVAASADQTAAEFVQKCFSTRWLRIYTSTDVLGVEFAGAVKNVVAIAAGILDGLGSGMNAKSALLARGLAEIVRLGSTMGARPETFFGVAGVGDLATTCFSPEGRNRSCGEAIGRGVPLERYLEQSKCVVEGVATTRAIMTLVERYEVEVPILSAVNDVLFGGVSARDAIDSLLSREAGPEIVG